MFNAHILHLISSKSFGGAERVVCELAYIMATGPCSISVGVMSKENELTSEFNDKLHGKPVTIVNFICKKTVSIKTINQIVSYINDNDINIIHCHGYKSDVYGYLVSLFVNQKVSLIATNHNWLVNTINEKIYKTIDLIVLRHFKRIIAVSQALYDEMISRDIPQEKLRVIDNGINVQSLANVTRETARLILGVNEYSIVVGCVASLTPEKQHRTLIHAIHELREFFPLIKLVLIGDGPLRKELEHLVDSLNVREQVIFLGYKKNVRDLYAAFDVFALVSEKEGLPMALLEAMAASLPVLVTPVGAITKVVTDALQGFIVKPGDIYGIVTALKTFAQNPQLRSDMGHESFKTVVEKYSNSRMAQDYETSYRELLAGIN